MYTAFLERTQRGIDSLRRHLATSEALRAAIHEGTLTCKGESPCFHQPLFSIEAAPDRLEWRVIDHCAAVTRIYAIYEQFAQEMIREHLSLLQTHIAFTGLPECLKTSYRKGLAEILHKKDGPRYGHLDLADLITQYDRALSGKPYQLEPVAMLMQEQNLRLPELKRLFAACGIENVDAWIEKHRSVIAFFLKDGRLTASAEHEIKELIEYRNDAAHGSINIDELPGLDYLFEFCDFVSAICEALSERVQLTGLECLINAGRALRRGKVSECIKSDLVLISKVTGSFKVGDTIYLCGDGYCMARYIVGLQVDDIDHSEVSLVEPTELGFAIDKPGRKKAGIITINSSSSMVVPANDDAATATAD
jgi:hypothetical protein